MCLRLPVCALLLLLYLPPATAEGKDRWYTKAVDFYQKVFTVDDKDRWYVVSMGDSITAGFNTRWPGDLNNVRYNWSTGKSKRVQSHLYKLKKIISKDVKAINVARSRATSHELALQWRNIKTPTIDYLTLLIGANDVCDWSDEYTKDKEKFRTNVQYIIDKAISMNTDVRILLPAIPNMYHLYEQGKDSCGGRWDYFEACPSLLSSKRNDEERSAFRQRLLEANATLEELATHYETNVKFVGAVYDYKFSIEHLSRIDCFHPSVLGQNELARVTWENGWYL